MDEWNTVDNQRYMPSCYVLKKTIAHLAENLKVYKWTIDEWNTVDNNVKYSFLLLSEGNYYLIILQKSEGKWYIFRAKHFWDRLGT